MSSKYNHEQSHCQIIHMAMVILSEKKQSWGLVWAWFDKVGEPWKSKGKLDVQLSRIQGFLLVKWKKNHFRWISIRTFHEINPKLIYPMKNLELCIIACLICLWFFIGLLPSQTMLKPNLSSVFFLLCHMNTWFYLTS